MKKILFLATLLISVFCFSSCSKDDEAIEVNQLEGVWGMTAVNGYYYYEGEKISYMKTSILLNLQMTAKKLL